MTAVSTWVRSSSGKTLETPKSAILASKLSFKRMFAVLTSLCIIGGLQPWCKYSNPAKWKTNVSHLNQTKPGLISWKPTLCSVNGYMESLLPAKILCFLT